MARIVADPRTIFNASSIRRRGVAQALGEREGGARNRLPEALSVNDERS
jgi:hypothetical protein